MPLLTLARKTQFSCGHRYWNDEWSPEKNQQVFGACTNPNGHGHSYQFEIFVEGPIDPVTGMIINLRDLDGVIHQIIEPINGTFINQTIPDFKKTIPTTENVLNYLITRLNQKLTGSVKLRKARLYETENLWVEWIKP